MATTFVKIATATVGSGGAATINFSSIPQTYTDLVVKISARNNETDNGASLRVYFNGDTANTNVKELRAISSTPASYTITYAQAGYVAADQTESNVFGTATVYIPNYTSSNYKSFSGEIILPSNVEFYSVLSSRLWSSTSAINQVTIANSLSWTWAQHTTATLYGIKNS